MTRPAWRDQAAGAFACARVVDRELVADDAIVLFADADVFRVEADDQMEPVEDAHERPQRRSHTAADAGKDRRQLPGNRLVVGADALAGPADSIVELSVGRLPRQLVAHDVAVGIVERVEDHVVGIAAHGERHHRADHGVMALAVRRGGEDLRCFGRRVGDVWQARAGSRR